MADEIKIEWVQEQSFETVPEFKLEEDKIPWLTEDKIDAWISIRGITWLSFFTSTFLRPTSNWRVNWSYTWVWFKPKLVRLEAVRSPNAVDPIFCINDIVEDWAGWFNYWELFSDDTWKAYVYSAKALRVTDAAWTPWTLATMVSFDDDWFTLNFSDNDYNVLVKVTCYW